MAQRELVLGKGRKLHRVLDETRTGREPGPRNAAAARVIGLQAVEHPVVIDAGRMGDRVKLVGDGEFDITVGVREQLGEFRLERRKRTTSGAIDEKTAATASSASGDVPLMICGSVCNSRTAKPWTIRSGQ